MRTLVVAGAIAVLCLNAAIPAHALYVPRGQMVSDCKNWDCEGGIICSCCFAGKGCWICDAGGVSKPYPKLDRCHWDPKSSGLVVQPTQPSGGFTPANPATRAPATRR